MTSLADWIFEHDDFPGTAEDCQELLAGVLLDLTRVGDRIVKNGTTTSTGNDVTDALIAALDFASEDDEAIKREIDERLLEL